LSRGAKKKTRIYTRGGDRGRTGLLDGSRVPKDNIRVAACGDVDELCAAVGLARAESRDRATGSVLRQVQRDLMAVGAQLADPEARVGARKAKAALAPALVERLEETIDAAEDRLPPLGWFILPGGSRAAAAIHLARAVCRRAERSVVALARRRRRVDPLVVAYLNRLSDLLFVLARDANHSTGVEEDRW
jgi:cob(I)alamin adenosyltransferase